MYPGASADKAGIRKGDILAVSTFSTAQQFQFEFRRAGQAMDLPIIRNGRLLHFHLVTGTTENYRPAEIGPLFLLLILVFAATGILVALRGSGRTEVRALAWLFVAWAWLNALSWLNGVAPTPPLAFIGGMGSGSAATFVGLIGFCQIAIVYCLLTFVSHFPPPVSRLRAAIGRCVLPITVIMVVISAWGLVTVLNPRATTFAIGGSPGFVWVAQLLYAVILPIVVAIAAIDGLMRVDEDHRVQMRWVGIGLILSCITPLYSGLYTISGNPNAPPLVNWLPLFGNLPQLLIAYAILRHRMVDLSIVISRAAVFAIVSAAVVVLVIILEWAMGQILERGIGAQAANGVAGQVVRLAVAVGVGLSAVPLLKVVEGWLNRVFFGKRAQALAELRRFALEADIVTSLTALLTLTCETLRETIEGRYAAIYMAEEGAYQRARSTENSLPLVLGENDAAVLRLRRWNEPFEGKSSDHGLSEALMLPMTIGGSLLGMIVCGPKRERTHYLNEEIEALSLVAHRVATAAYVLLHRESHTLASDLPAIG